MHFRYQFSVDLLKLYDENDGLIDRIWWSDEATFNLSGTINRHNSIWWADTNPNWTWVKMGKSKSLTAWFAVSSQGIIGPYFFHELPAAEFIGPMPFKPVTCTAERYVAMLDGFFKEKFNQLPEPRENLFQQDAAPPHTALITRNWLNNNFHNQWIGKFAPAPSLNFPPRSPDLTPCDFCFWGMLKPKVYATRPETLEELQREIIKAFQAIDIATCERVCRSVPRRLETCIELGGGQVIKSIFKN